MKYIFLTLLCAIIIFVAICWISHSVFNRRILNEISEMRGESDSYATSKVRLEQLFELPLPVSNWLKSSGVVGKEKIYFVWLKQEAKMKMNPEQQKWNSITAEQCFSIEAPAFIWKVKMNILPFLKIIGRDKFFDGKGEMLIKIFSLFNVVNEKGVKMDEGTLQRYLGEIVWFPTAALSSYITWEEIDAFTAKATMEYMGTKGSGTFHFNKKGDFIRYSALRYKGNEPNAKRHEWEINVSEYAVKNGVKIPVKMTATWKLDEGDWTWLDLEVKEIRYN